MRPYGMKIGKRCKVHAADDCSVCRSYPPSHKEARSNLKQELLREFVNYQEKLGTEFEKVLHDNSWELYEE